MSQSARKLRISWAAIAAPLALTLSALRAIQLENGAGSTSCNQCLLLPTFGHDAWLLAVLFGLLALATFVQRRWLRIVCGSIAALLILASALDLALLRLFDQRLYLEDLLRFTGAGTANWSVVRAFLFSAEGMSYAAIDVAAGIVAIGLVSGRGRSPRVALMLAIGMAVMAMTAALVLRAPQRYPQDPYAWNVIEANLPQGRAKQFSQRYLDQELQRSEALPADCAAGARAGGNVVIVITESLSAYQSALLGGPQNWLPRLDALARANHYFTHFYANGFTTDGGEIAALTGRAPLIPPGIEWYSLAAFGADENTLPAIAHRSGHTAHYFTTADLGFLDSGAWLRQLEFDSVEGSESPFYAGMPRGQFSAADDAALFARFEQWLDQRSDPRPFVAVLLTVSSHPPFVDPRSGKTDMKGSFDYVDEQITTFHAHLDQRGFLANGILLIMGDHRSMTPMQADEYKKFGERAFSRIPLIVAGAVDMPKVVDAAFQQSDVPPSLARMLGATYCRTAFAGYFLDPKPMPPKYVVHTRGDDRNRIDVYSDAITAAYFEDGDASGWADAQQPPDAQTVAAWLVAQRARNTVPASRSTIGR